MAAATAMCPFLLRPCFSQLHVSPVSPVSPSLCRRPTFRPFLASGAGFQGGKLNGGQDAMWNGELMKKKENDNFFAGVPRISFSNALQVAGQGPPGPFTGTTTPAGTQGGGGVYGNGNRKEQKFVYYVDGGGKILAFVNEAGGKFKLHLEANLDTVQHSKETPVFLHWGLFRSDLSAWVMVDPIDAPLGTKYLTDDIDAMQTPWRSTPQGHLAMDLEFNAAQAPFAVNFVLYQPGSAGSSEGRWFRSTKDSNFCIPIGMGKGRPEPLGVTWERDGSVNFALYSRAAEGVVLCLYQGEEPDPSMEIDLEPSLHRTGDTWHVSLNGVGSFTRYGYRCKGEISWERGARFHSRHVLLDPYASIVASPVPGQEDWPSPAAALGLLAREDLSFDWEDDLPPSIPMEEMVVYRMDVARFTAGESSGVADVFRGTFLGVVEKVDHLVSLGVNTLILQPIAAYDETQGCYFPISFFAPMPSYGPGGDGQSACSALKLMVKELHKKGIEVIMEVVYSHTAEQRDDDPKTVSFRGIDNATYYIIDEFGQQVIPTFGGGNAFNCNHPVIQQMIVESLRHWVDQYHVDGFCFINSGALVTGPHSQELSRPLLVEAIAFDPVLAATKLIADPCSPITGDCQVISFPHWGRWQEMNHMFSQDVRHFVRGEPAQLSNIATRFYGSGDLFSSGRSPCFSLNYVTAPYGFTITDLVSYSNDKEFSWNCGEEGPSVEPLVTDCRMRQVRNFLVQLLLFQGVPTLTMGDEYGHSKGGSTELEVSPFQWNALELEVSQQLCRLIWSLVNFRSRRRTLLQRRTFLEPEALSWHGFLPDQPQWDNPDSNFLAVTIREPNSLVTSTSGKEEALGDLYIALNSHHYAITVHLPIPSPGMSWYRVIDTNLSSPHDFTVDGLEVRLQTPDGLNSSSSAAYEMAPYSFLLLEARGERSEEVGLAQEALGGTQNYELQARL